MLVVVLVLKGMTLMLVSFLGGSTMLAIAFGGRPGPLVGSSSGLTLGGRPRFLCRVGEDE